METVLFQGVLQDGFPHPVVLFYFTRKTVKFRTFRPESLKNP